MRVRTPRKKSVKNGEGYEQKTGKEVEKERLQDNLPAIYTAEGQLAHPEYAAEMETKRKGLVGRSKAKDESG